MKCEKCGGELTESGVCAKCKTVYVNIQDSTSIWWLVFALLLPVVAIILYCLWRYKKPVCARRLATGAIISLSILLVVYLVLVLLAIITGGNIFSQILG